MNAPPAAIAPSVDGGETHAPAGAPGLWRVVLPVWLFVYGLLVFANFGDVAQLKAHDPDDLLRLQQVRDLIAGQGWFDLQQYRIDAAGGGVPMHWSRIVDVPVALLLLVLTPIFGQHVAETAALLIVPGVTLLAIMALAGIVAARHFARPAVIMTLLVLAVAVPVIVQTLPGRIDHHGWQIALALAAVGSLLHRDGRKGGWLAGAALAVWMAISFEGLPFSAWFVAVLALAALIDPAQRKRLVAAMQALGLVSVLLFTAMRGSADLVQHCDAISPVHIAAFVWGALVLMVAQVAAPMSRVALIGALALAGAGALGLVFALAPQCTSGSFDMLDPVVRSVWYDQVQEGKPLWRTRPHLAAQYLIPPLVGLLAAIRLLRSTRGEERGWWALYGLLLTGAIAISVLVSRSASVSTALAAVPLGWQLSRWLESLRRPPNLVLRLGELFVAAAVMFAILLPVVPVMALEKMVAGEGKIASQDKAFGKPCNVRAARAAMASLPPGGILAPLDMGPEILVHTDRDVLATGHHRGAKAMRLVIDAFSEKPEVARRIMADKRLGYVAICTSVEEIHNYRKRGKDGLAAMLIQNRAPDWLEPVKVPAKSGMRLWKIREIREIRPAGTLAPRR